MNLVFLAVFNAKDLNKLLKKTIQSEAEKNCLLNTKNLSNLPKYSFKIIFDFCDAFDVLLNKSNVCRKWFYGFEDYRFV